MRDTDLYAQILGIASPWRVTGVDLRLSEGEVEVRVEYGGEIRCPACSQVVSRYDTRERKWRHLDTCQYQTILAAQVPRSNCPEHGVKTISVPWAEPGSSFTALMEALIIDWLSEAILSAVADLLGLTWDQVDGVLQRAVARGLARRSLVVPSRVGVDETSFQKRHEYVTIVADTQRGVVQHVADGHGVAALAEYYSKFSREDLAQIESVSMDMWGPYIAATRAAIPAAESKIAFDKFHVAQNLGNAVDQVRRQEHRSLKGTGDTTLTKTRSLRLTHPDHLKPESREKLKQLTQKALKTSRAWMLKELAMEMWTSGDPEEAKEIFDAWYSWAIRSRLEPMKRAARMLKRHLQGVLNAIGLGVTNARLEGINNLIQGLKRSARGFRNRDRFRNAIYFHFGGLDLYPAKVTHSKA